MKTIAIILALMLICLKGISVAGPLLIPQRMRVDTVYSVKTVYDTVTMVSRAADTIRIRIKDAGPLTEQDLARLICGEARTYGDKRDEFSFNAYGMIFCPADPK